MSTIKEVIIKLPADKFNGAEINIANVNFSRYIHAE